MFHTPAKTLFTITCLPDYKISEREKQIVIDFQNDHLNTLKYCYNLILDGKNNKYSDKNGIFDIILQ